MDILKEKCDLVGQKIHMCPIYTFLGKKGGFRKENCSISLQVLPDLVNNYTDFLEEIQASLALTGRTVNRNLSKQLC